MSQLLFFIPVYVSSETSVLLGIQTQISLGTVKTRFYHWRDVTAIFMSVDSQKSWNKTKR